MKRFFLYLFLILPLGMAAQIVADTLTDDVDSTEMMMLDRLIEQEQMDESETVTLHYQLTDLDCRLVDWAMEWLDTTACESAQQTVTLTAEGTSTCIWGVRNSWRR
jgi:hypothetical protein